ncbi:hypothetical protein [Photobacterium leiognathi]|uniref:hypothetical protein n=1 Tax=Photobacterium leiognathi TaxID=553611 RepID=UPI0029824CE2|nr:hypothetical protein [Photobacterium leiognathi]
MNTSEWFAFAAILVAALSALYARWAWSEAHKANKISLHGHKKEIYDAFFELKMHMEQEEDLAERDHIHKFYYGSRNARFYFCEKIADKLQNYFDQCFYIADLNSTKITQEQRFDLMDKVKVAKALSVEIEKLISEDIKLSD